MGDTATLVPHGKGEGNAVNPPSFAPTLPAPERFIVTIDGYREFSDEATARAFADILSGEYKGRHVVVAKVINGMVTFKPGPGAPTDGGTPIQQDLVARAA